MSVTDTLPLLLPVDPLLNRVTTLYDSLGRVVGTQDGRGNIVTTVYDSLGR